MMVVVSGDSGGGRPKRQGRKKAAAAAASPAAPPLRRSLADLDPNSQDLNGSCLPATESVNMQTSPRQALVEGRINYNQPDHEIGPPRPINCGTLHGSTTPTPKSTERTDQTIREAGLKETSNGTEFSGGHSQQLTLQMLGSEQASPCPYGTHESNNVIVKKLDDMQRTLVLITDTLKSMKEQNQGCTQKDNFALRKRRSTKKKSQILNQKENIPPGKLESMVWVQAITQTELQDKEGCSYHNNSNLEPLVQEVKQEVTGAKDGGLATDNGKRETKKFHLRFLNGLKTPVYHEDELKPDDGNSAIKIGIYEEDTMIRSGPLSEAIIEILALEGDFRCDARRHSWSPKEFDEHRAKGRDGKGIVLVGEGTTAQLINGECDLRSIKFKEGSSKARNGKFIVGARVSKVGVTGVQVQEAVMEPVVVLDRRNKPLEKAYPPMLDHPVHRLEEIAKDGTYSKRLEKEGIYNVEGFLKALNKDPVNLRKVLQVKEEHKNWEAMVRHARTCHLNDELKSYPITDRLVLFFNCVHCLLGAKFDGGPYTACENFSPRQKLLVEDGLKRVAYDHLDDRSPDYVIEENRPVPMDPDTNATSGAAPSHMLSATQQNLSDQLTAPQVGDTSTAVEGLGHAQTESPGANANNDPAPGSHNIHVCQDQGTQPAGQEQFTSAPLNPVEPLTPSNWTVEDQDLLGYQVEAQLPPSTNFLPQVDTVNCVDLVSGHEDIMVEDSFWQQAMAAHSNMTLAPQQHTITVDSASGHEEIPGDSFRQDNDLLEAPVAAHSDMALTPHQHAITIDLASGHEDIMKDYSFWQDGIFEAIMATHSNMTSAPQQHIITVDSGLGHDEIPGHSFWQGNNILEAPMVARNNMTLTPQQLTVTHGGTGAPGSRQGNTQGQIMQAPLPLSNGALEPSASAHQDSHPVPPRQWPHCQGNSMLWNRSL